MQNNDTIKPKAKNFTGVKRKALSLSPAEVIKTSYLREGRTLPLVVEPAGDQVECERGLRIGDVRLQPFGNLGNVETLHRQRP
jgi:hypothetical protein